MVHLTLAGPPPTLELCRDAQHCHNHPSLILRVLAAQHSPHQCCHESKLPADAWPSAGEGHGSGINLGDAELGEDL